MERLNLFSLLKSVAELGADVIKVAAAPIEVAVDLAAAVVKPVAEVAQEIVDTVKELK